MTIFIAALVALVIAAGVGYYFRGTILADLEDAKADIQKMIGEQVSDVKSAVKGATNTLEGRVKNLENKAKASVANIKTQIKKKL